MGFVTQLLENTASQAAGAATGGLFGQLFAGANDRRQRRQQQHLTDMQLQANLKQMQAQKDFDYEMWQKTGFVGQLEQIKKAGLSPGLIYGMGGAGGTTTGGGGGNVSAPSAPSGGGEMIAMAGQAAQYALMDAQRRNIDADTKLKQAEAANKPLTGENIQADTGLKSLQARLAKIQTEIQSATIEEAIQKITMEASILQEQNTQAGVKTQVDRGTQQANILTTQAGLIKALLDNKQVQEQTKLTKEQTAAIAQTIAQGWAKIRQGDKQLTYEEWGREIQQQIADFQTTHPNMEQIKGNLLDELIRGLRKIANIQ